MSYTPKNPNGSATSANSSPVVIASDQAAVPVSNTGLTNLNGAIVGTEVQVDIVAALPAGTNNIGDVDIASIAAGDNNIGNVDVVTMPGTGVEDAPETAGGTLLMSGTVRRDTAASSAGTTGDNATINTDSVGALWTRDTASQVDDAAFTPATGRILPVGFLADETATDSVDEGDAGIARMTLDRKQIITPYVHAASGGWTPFRSIDLDETEEEVKGTAGKIGWIHVMNMSASVRYLKIYNATAASVTVGTTTPTYTFPIPTLATTNGAGFMIPMGDAGTQFSTAITVAATTGLADNDTGAPGANEVIINLGYV